MKKILLGAFLLGISSVVAADNILNPESQEALNVYAKAVMDNDKAGYLKGHDAMLSTYIPTMNAAKLISEYKSNELAADKKYKKKLVRVKTIVSSIKSDVLGNGYIAANGKNQFEDIQLYINESDDRILALKASDKIDFICQGSGVSMGMPILKECTFTEDYVNAIYGAVEKALQNAQAKGYMPKSNLELSVLALYKMAEKSLQPACLKSTLDCLKVAEDMNRDKVELNQEFINVINDNSASYENLPPLPKIEIDKRTRLFKLLS